MVFDTILTDPGIVGLDYRITDDIRPSKLYAAYDMFDNIDM